LLLLLQLLLLPPLHIITDSAQNRSRINPTYSPITSSISSALPSLLVPTTATYPICTFIFTPCFSTFRFQNFFYDLLSSSSDQNISSHRIDFTYRCNNHPFLHPAKANPSSQTAENQSLYQSFRSMWSQHP
jgi:hypothetical protein